VFIAAVLFVALVGASPFVGTASAQVTSASTPQVASTRAGETVAVEGIAEFRHGDVVVVSGYRLQSTPDTRFAGTDITSLSAVLLGFRVEAKGVVQPNGTIAVQELDARPRDRSDAGRGVVVGALDQEGKWLSGGGSIFRAALASNAPETRLPKADPHYERVSGILMRMVPASLDDSLRLHIVNSPDWNARGLPNGSIAVAAGLLADMDDDEVAIVLGHELAHITHEHAQKTLADAERRKFVTQLIGDLIPDGGLVTQLALTVGGAVALKTWQSGYSRSLETEADRVGLGYAAAGGFDVRKAPRVWERFQEKYGSEQTLKNFVVGNHPRNEERVKNARVELQAHYPNYMPSAMPPPGSASASTLSPQARPVGQEAALPSGGQLLASGTTPTLPSPAPTLEITKGMTDEQVRALLGAPKEEFLFTNSEGKQTKWVFAHLKVTFLNGRVTLVEF
jgi:Zn-dependent protease with chaperone function